MSRRADRFVPQVIDRLLPEAEFERVRRHMDRVLSDFTGLPYSDATRPPERRFNRYATHNDPLHVEIHEQLVPMVAERVGRPVKKSYAFASMYGGEGVCPRHTDRPQCEYTLDLCVSQGAPWGIWVDAEEFLLEENQALLFNGTRSPHHREPIQPGNYCNLVFFHFVDIAFDGPLD